MVHEIIERVGRFGWSAELRAILEPHLRDDTAIQRAVRCNCGAVGVGATAAAPYTWTSAQGVYHVHGTGDPDCPAIAAWVDGSDGDRVRNANAALGAL